MARLFRRGQRWFAWVPKPGGGTRRVATHCTDRKAAERRAAQLEREALDPSHAAANRVSTNEACAEFFESRERRGRSAGTLHHYGVKLGHVVRLMPERLCRVDARACEDFITKRLAEGAAQTTVKKELRALGAVLRHSKRTGLYEGDVDSVIPELEDTYRPRKRRLDAWELIALCNRLERARAAHVVFVCMTGARWGESVRACREDASMDDWTVRLRGTKTKAAAGVVPIPPPFRRGLAWALAGAPEDRPLFYAWGNVRRDLAVACAAVGMEPVTPNDLRRSFATWLREWGVSTDLIAAALRHTSTRMVDRVYGRLGTSELGRLLEERTPAGLLMDRTSVQTSPDDTEPDNT